MNWLAIIAAALGILRSLIEILTERQKIDAAVAQALLKSNREALDAIATADKARAEMRAALVRGSDPVSDDGFRRND